MVLVSNAVFLSFFKKLLTSILVCGIIFKQCGYGGIGRRVWFRLRYDSVKNKVSQICETFLITV